MLTLTIKKEWFDRIASGEKRIEYRRLSPYYERLFTSGKKYTAVTFHYYRRERLHCNVVRIRKIPKPAALAGSTYLTGSECWAIYLSHPEVFTV